MDDKFIAHRISKLRNKKNISARNLSLELQQSENYINRIETYKMLPSIKVLYSICDILNVTPSEFFNSEPTELEERLMCADNETKELLLHILKKIEEK